MWTSNEETRKKNTKTSVFLIRHNNQENDWLITMTLTMSQKLGSLYWTMSVKNTWSVFLTDLTNFFAHGYFLCDIVIVLILSSTFQNLESKTILIYYLCE